MHPKLPMSAHYNRVADAARQVPNGLERLERQRRAQHKGQRFDNALNPVVAKGGHAVPRPN